VSDHILVSGIRARGFHGVHPDERRDGQVFVVDLDVEADLTSAAATDSLDETVDYATLARRVVAVIEGEACDLIETVAGRIAMAVLDSPRAIAVTVTVHKPQVPLAVPVADVAVTMTRRRL
jgi:dihydroneopterin aldolase